MDHLEAMINNLDAATDYFLAQRPELRLGMVDWYTQYFSVNTPRFSAEERIRALLNLEQIKGCITTYM